MSSISALQAQAASLSLVDFLNKKDQAESSILDSSTTMASSELLLSNSQNKRAQSAYGTGLTSSAGQAALKKALEEMGANERTVTLSEIRRYREQLEEEFSANLRGELKALGVGEDVEFSVSIDTEGKVKVTCDDALAKEKIERYFVDNPGASEQFGYIQALSNLNRAQRSPAAASQSWSAIANGNNPLSAAHLEAFFCDALGSGMGYSSLLASFGSNASSAASFYTGLDFTV
ncbi:hypothetical protein LJC59_08070 [Desulfovibrio sp. OttesenSCG-928-A18]|nr:hypothetical protein [Desulfovibrio sp. OttesenSCG-928-A18]